MDNRHIVEIAEAYLDRFPEDRRTIDQLRQLIEAGADVTSRKETRGHVTCGGIVVGVDGRILMVHHRILDRWLFPGGQVEPGDASLRESALREIQEETGLTPENIATFGDFDMIPVHIDCHRIPANPTKGEPDHQHFDFRFIFRGNTAALRTQEEEVLGCEWVSADLAPAPVRDRLRYFKAL